MSRKISDLLSQLPAGEKLSAEILDILHEGSSLQQIMEYAYNRLQNPLMLVDVSFNFEASAGTEHLDNEPVWEYTEKNGFMPNYYLNHIAGYISGYEYNDINDGDDGFYIENGDSPHINHYQITSRIFHNDRQTGYIMLMQKNRDITENDKVFLKLIASILSICMSRQLGREDFRFSVIENFLTSIIRNKITNPEEIETRQELFGIRLYDYLHVITIEFTDYKVRDDKKFYLLRKIKKLFARNNVVMLNDYIVILYDTKTKEEAFSESVTSELVNLLEKYNCVADISYTFTQLKDFYKYYVQTVYCMDMREMLGIRDTIVRYSDVIEYHMLSSFSDQIDLDLLLHDAIKELLKTDTDNDSDYVNTLFTYVNCQQNLSKAAERMQLHYNTLKYRVNRIIAMTGIDLNDENVVFSIMISERILKIKEYMQHTDYVVMDKIQNR